MLKTYLYVLCYIILFIIPINAQKVEFSGFGKTGINIYDRNILLGYSQEMYYSGKMQLDLEYDDNIEGQLDFRGNSIDNELELREFSVKFKYAEKLKWKVGNIKKPFGYEQSVGRDHLISIERSHVYNYISELGFGGRNISIMAYYNYSDKREDYPYSYYLSIFKDNSLTSGMAARGVYHNGKYSYGLSYLFQNRGGENSISAHGMAAEFLIEKKDYSSSVELFFVQDPVLGQERIAQNKNNKTNLDESIFSTGGKLLTSIEYKTDAEVITKIEPLLMLSLLVLDTNDFDDHVIQTLIGSNFYFTKKVRISFNGDLRLTKNSNNDDYVTDESRVSLELQVRF